MDILTTLALSSDAAQLAVIGAVFWALAAFAALMEWRRKKTRDYAQLERVGWVPWTAIFIMCAMIGGGCLAMSLPVVLGNL